MMLTDDFGCEGLSRGLKGSKSEIFLLTLAYLNSALNFSHIPTFNSFQGYIGVLRPLDLDAKFLSPLISSIL